MKGGDYPWKKKNDYLSTLFVGIDIASRVHVISALDFNQDFYIKKVPAPNTLEGVAILEGMIVDVLKKYHQFKYVIIGMESTGFYGVHLANYLSTSDLLAPFSVRVYCLNPKEMIKYKKSFNNIGKNDGIDSLLIADFARVGRISIKPWRGSQHLALQHLTRHRMHITECIAREKTYMLNNIILQFSEYAFLRDGEHPFQINIVLQRKRFLLNSQQMKISLTLHWKNSSISLIRKVKVASLIRKRQLKYYRLLHAIHTD